MTVWALQDESIEAIESLYDYEHSDFDDINTWLKFEESIWDWVFELDRLAQEHDTILGRYFTRPVADGKALYIVYQYDDEEDTVDVMSVPVGDRWQDQVIAAMDNALPVKVAQKFIDSESAIKKLFWSVA